jgi:hypothetical protein
MRRPHWLIVAFAVSAAADQQGLADHKSRDAERRIARWNSAEEDAYAPPSCIRVERFQLDGEWSSGNQTAQSHLRFTRMADGRFAVVFNARFSLLDLDESWTLKRTATLDHRGVILNRGVEDHGGIYTRLWPLEVGPYKQVALVPTVVLGDVRRAFQAGGCNHFNAAFECSTCFGQGTVR